MRLCVHLQIFIFIIIKSSAYLCRFISTRILNSRSLFLGCQSFCVPSDYTPSKLQAFWSLTLMTKQAIWHTAVHAAVFCCINSYYVEQNSFENWQLLVWSKSSSPFMEPEGSLPYSLWLLPRFRLMQSTLTCNFPSMPRSAKLFLPLTF
jgi:hypothetical protein